MKCLKRQDAFPWLTKDKANVIENSPRLAKSEDYIVEYSNQNVKIYESE